MRWTDEQVELLVSQWLRFGVLVSATTVLVGLTLACLQHQAGLEVHQFGAPSGSLVPSLSDLAALHSLAVIQLGLLILIATPIVRVALCVLAFAVQRDPLYIALTAMVLTVLLYGLVAA